MQAIQRCRFSRAFTGTLLCAGAVWLAALQVAADPSEVLFHASFDKTPDYADVAYGETRDVATSVTIRRRPYRQLNPLRPGRFGQGLFQPRGFQAHGNVNVRSGTIAFWFRQGQPIGDMYYPIIEIKTVDNYFWWRYFSLHGKNSKVHAEFMDRDHMRRTLHLPEWSHGEWQHVAVTWDCLRGFKIYLNGRVVASNWGKTSWPSIDMHLEQIVLPCLRDGGYDELWVFGQPLTDREIGVLFESNTFRPSSAGPAPRDELALRRTELGWPFAHEAPVLADSRPLTAVSVPIVAAKSLKREVWRGVDGKQGSSWPSMYQGYQYLNGGGYHMFFPDKRRINYVTITGGFRGDMFAGTAIEKPPAEKRLVAIEPTTFAWGHHFDPPLEADGVSFFKRKLDGEREGNDNIAGSVVGVSDRRSRMCNLQMFELKSARPDGFSGTATYRLGALASLDYLTPWLAEALAGIYGPDQRTACLLATGGTTAPNVAIETMGLTHLFTPAVHEDTFLDAITLAWAGGPARPGLMRLVVHDPITPTRELVSLDVRLTGSGKHEITLDHVDTIIPQARRIWITLHAERAVVLGDLRVLLHRNTRKKVLVEYEARQRGFIKDGFMSYTEPRPWSGVADRDDAMFLGRVYRGLGEMYDALHEFRKHNRKHRLVEGIRVWTHPSGAHPRGTARLSRDDQKAPPWAAYAKLALNRLLAMPHWWIDNRQVPNGEFGSNLGDDSDLVQDWPSLAMISDPGGKLSRSLHLVGNACWDRNMEDGINRRVTDALHAYETGINVQPHMALLSYGNPVYLERLMLGARTVEERLMGRTENGHLHFRSWMYGAHEVVTELKYGVDSTTNSLMLHPAIFLMYYNGNPRAKRVLTEHVRALMEDFYLNGKKWPNGVRFEGHVLQKKGRRTTLGGHGFLFLITAAYEHTRDPRILQTLRDSGFVGDEGTSSYLIRMLEMFRKTDLFQRNPSYLRRAREIDLSALGTTALSDARYDWKYLAWALTGDKDYLAQAAKRLAERMDVTLPMQTEAEQSADRVQLSKKLIDRMYLGGVAVQRNEIFPRHHVSYEGLNSNYAALVLEGSPKRLRVLLYNFDKRSQKGRMRVWQLENGTYRVRFGPDANEDDKLDSVSWEKTMPLQRYAPVEFTLPRRQLQLVEFEQIEKGDDLFQRADLAVATEDATWDPSRDRLTFVVHNVGTTTAEKVTVRILGRGDAVIKTFDIDRLEAPLDLVPRRVEFTVENVRRVDAVAIVVDPDGRIPEIYEGNNRFAIDDVRRAEALGKGR